MELFPLLPPSRAYLSLTLLVSHPPAREPARDAQPWIFHSPYTDYSCPKLREPQRFPYWNQYLRQTEPCKSIHSRLQSPKKIWAILNHSCVNLRCRLLQNTYAPNRISNSSKISFSCCLGKKWGMQGVYLTNTAFSELWNQGTVVSTLTTSKGPSGVDPTHHWLPQAGSRDCVWIQLSKTNTHYTSLPEGMVISPWFSPGEQYPCLTKRANQKRWKCQPYCQF